MASNTTEDKVREMFGHKMIDAMRNKDKIADELLRILQEQATVMKGLDKFITAIDDGKTSNAQLGQMVKTLCRSSQAQSNAVRQLSMSTLIYVCGGDFDADCAKLASTFGMGREALGELFRAKMRAGRKPL